MAPIIQISTAGPQGPTGPQGPKGDPGAITSSVDVSITGSLGSSGSITFIGQGNSKILTTSHPIGHYVIENLYPITGSGLAISSSNLSPHNYNFLKIGEIELIDAYINTTHSFIINNSKEFIVNSGETSNDVAGLGTLFKHLGDSFDVYIKDNSKLRITNNSTTIYNNLILNSGVTGSLLGTSSYSLLANTASQAVSSSYSITASYALNSNPFPYIGNAVITGSLTVTGDVKFPSLTSTPKNHVVTYDTSTGQLFITASTAFGGGGGGGGSTPGGVFQTIQYNDSGVLGGNSMFTFYPLSSTVILTGSLISTTLRTNTAVISGSLTLTGSVNSLNGFTGSLLGSSSYAQQSLSSSFAINSNQAISSSFAISSSYASSSLVAVNASYSTTALLAFNAISASHTVSSSYTLSASYALNTSQASSSSYALTASYALNGETTNTGSLVSISSFNIFTSSIEASVNTLTQATSSYILNSQTSSFVQNSQTSSFVTNSQTSSMSVATSSYAVTASYVLINNTISSSYALSSSFATSASYALNSNPFPYIGNVIITGSLTTTGDVKLLSLASTPKNHVVTYDTSTGQLFITASTAFGGGGITTSSTPGGNSKTIQFNDDGFLGGDDNFTYYPISSTVILTGSLIANTLQLDSALISDSLTVTGSITSLNGFTGSLLGTASLANNALTSDQATNAINATSATSASYALSSSTTISASHASTSGQSISSSQATSASYSLTASYALNAAGGGFTPSLLTDLVARNITSSANITATGFVSASLYYGDGSNLTGIGSNPFPYTGDALITGSLSITGSLTANNINADELNLTSTGTPVFIGDTNLILSASNAVVIQSPVLRLVPTTTSSAESIAQNGDIVYDSNQNKFFGRANGVWVAFH